MKKNKNRKIKVNAYYNGMDTINNIVGATSVVGSALSGISDEGSAANTAGNVLSSAGSLAAAGSAFGPIGTGVGAALGAVVGGISAARRRKQLIDKRIRDNYIKSTEVGMNQSAADAEEYWNNNNVAYSFENGGILPDLAYVDNNEILRDDNGNITKVPNNIPGTDNHLIDSSSLDSVLSDNIKRPGTKNTFAKEGEKLVKRMKPSKGKDKFAENTNRLNKLNANKSYEALLAEQEQVKAKKGIKPKTKSLIPAYLDGKERSGIAEWLINEFNSNQTGTARSDAKKQAAKNILNSGWLKKIYDYFSNSPATTNYSSKDKAKEELDINAILSQAADYHNALALQKDNKESNRNNVDETTYLDRAAIPLILNSYTRDSYNNYNKPGVIGLRNSSKEKEKDRENALQLAAFYLNNADKLGWQDLYSTALREANRNNVDGMTYEDKSVNSSSSNYDDVMPEVNYSMQPVTNTNSSSPKAAAYVSTTATKPVASTNTTLTNTKPNSETTTNVTKTLNPFSKKLEAKPLSTKPNYPTTLPKVDTGNISKKNTQSKDNKSVYPIDWASLAPTIYNTLQGLKDPEIDPLVTNPYNNQIINSMAKRRMNIDPILSANARSRAISNYNLANLNANTGANLAARTQAAVNEYAANEALYGTKQNADNAYIADYANTLNNLGQQYTSSKATNIDLNARNRAATRSFASKAASQLGEWSQINSKMRNEYNRDMMMWPLLEDFLSQGYTTDKLAQLKRYM